MVLLSFNGPSHLVCRKEHDEVQDRDDRVHHERERVDFSAQETKVQKAQDKGEQRMLKQFISLHIGISFAVMHQSYRSDYAFCATLNNDLLPVIR